jgi:hypothetical protein
MKISSTIYIHTHTHTHTHILMFHIHMKSDMRNSGGSFVTFMVMIVAMNVVSHCIKHVLKRSPCLTKIFHYTDPTLLLTAVPVLPQ